MIKVQKSSLNSHKHASMVIPKIICSKEWILVYFSMLNGFGRWEYPIPKFG